MEYSYTKKVSWDFSDALSKVTQLLGNEWFGVIFNMDVKSKIKEKLNKDMGNYVIIWVCNPLLAYEALQSEVEIWLLLPCNVIVYEKWSEVFVSTIIPSTMLSVTWNNDLIDVVEIAESKLKWVIDKL